MRRGSSLRYLSDTVNRRGEGNGLTGRNCRRPSKIEERIRMRRLSKDCDSNKKNLRGPVKLIDRSSNDAASSVSVCDNSRGSSSSSAYNKTANSCSSSSSGCTIGKVCTRDGSKEFVDLLETSDAPLTSILKTGNNNDAIAKKKSKSRVKSRVMKICRGETRPRSAPCSPLFRIKCVKHNSSCNGRNQEAQAVGNFIDCKIVERDCIDAEKRSKDRPLEDRDDDDAVDNEPLGNPALISLMKESLDKFEAADMMKTERNCEPEVIAVEPISDSNDALHDRAENDETEIEATPRQESNFTNCDDPSREETHRKTEEKKEEEVEEEEHLVDRRKCETVEVPPPPTEAASHSQKIDSDDRKNCRCCKMKCRDPGVNRESNSSASPRHPESFTRRFNSSPDRRFVEKIGACNSPRKLQPTVLQSCISHSCRHNEYRYLKSGTRRIKIQDRRSSSSPRRRVTFRFPSLVIPVTEEREDEENEKNSKNSSAKFFGSIGNNANDDKPDKESDKIETRKLNGIFTTPIVSSSSCCCSNHRANFRPRPCSNCRCDKSTISHGPHQRRSRSPKTVHFCEEIATKHNHRNAVIDNPDYSDSKDWAVDPDDDFTETAIRNNVVSFPKETRQAMNVLLQLRHRRGSKERRCSMPLGITGQQQQQQSFREANVLKKPDLEIFNIKGDNKAMHVATYAQALAVFQRTCDPLAGTSCKKKRNIAWRESDGEIIVNTRKKYPNGRINRCNRNDDDHDEAEDEDEDEDEDEEPFDYNFENLNEATRNVEINERDNRLHQHLNFHRNLPKPESDLRTFSGSGRPTGLKMQTNGSENGSSENGVDRTGWTVGLINGRFKYLTAETFGFKINANGASLKKKQLWTLEGSEHQVFLRSHLDRYLAVDQFGNVTCEAEDTADPGCAFQIQVASDGSGRWALKNIQRGYFLGSSQDELKCTAKVPSDAEYWLVHLAARPQVNLRSAGRKRFAHLSAAQDEIHVDAPVPWGEDTLFTLEFRPAAMPDAVEGNGDVRREVRSEAGIGGHYALHTCNNKYLARDGKLLDSCTRDCLYAAEFHAGMLALRDVSGAYLAPIGSKAVLKSRSNTVTRDELFSLEDSLPQASFVAALNQRYVSVKQGVDVTANQDEISGHETFQLEFDRGTKRWYLRTMQDRYWTLEAGGGIQASDHKRSSNALFDLIWQPADGTVALRANNGKFLATKRSGHLYANADTPGESEASKFYFYLMNRPVLVLRCEQGFVGLKSNASPKLECNKASYETIRVERCDRGIVRFKGQNGKYWHADSEGVTSDADVPSDGFYLELREPSRICIKSTDGRYLSAGKNGMFRLGDTDYESATKWEF